MSRSARATTPSRSRGTTSPRARRALRRAPASRTTRRSTGATTSACTSSIPMATCSSSSGTAAEPAGEHGDAGRVRKPGEPVRHARAPPRRAGRPPPGRAGAPGAPTARRRRSGHARGAAEDRTVARGRGRRRRGGVVRRFRPRCALRRRRAHRASVPPGRLRARGLVVRLPRRCVPAGPARAVSARGDRAAGAGRPWRGVGTPGGHARAMGRRRAEPARPSPCRIPGATRPWRRSRASASSPGAVSS